MNHGHGRSTRNGHRRLVAALVALGVSGGCSIVGSGEESSARGSGNLSGEACQVVPPFVPNFEPELQWAWLSSPILPEFRHVMMTPVVIDVNKDGTPDIVFSTFRDSDAEFVWKEGVLRAISGDDGRDLWAVTDPAYRIRGAASIAAGDIDNDGHVDICGIPFDGHGIICYGHDGSFKFRSALPASEYNEWGGPSLADLDGDGQVEILNGNRVYSNTGALKWVGSDGMGGAQWTGPVSFAADIDGDGKQEVINGRSVYRHDGTLYCANTDIDHGFASVANFDGDTQAEIVVSGFQKVSLLDDNCALLWSVTIPGGCQMGCGGPPNIADFDNDGMPEIGLPGDNAYTVFETNGSVKWSSTIQEWSSGKSGSTAFDFEDDGQMEIVYADEVQLRIYNGATGAVRYQTHHSTGTTHENPVVADVDGDLAADIVLANNNTAYPPYAGLRVYHDRLEGWARTRPMWNQHAYSITNINDDGSIPAQPVRHWLEPKLNKFRSNVANYLGTGGNPYAAADLTIQGLGATCDGYSGLTVSATIHNQGAAPVAAGLKVALYRGTPGAGGSLLGVTTIPNAIPAGGSALVSMQVGPQPGGSSQAVLVVDDDGTGQGRETECDETNNTATATVDFSCGTPPTNQPPVAICKDITVPADAVCQGTGSVDNGSYDPDNNPGPFTVSEAPAGPFGLGSHGVTLTANDGAASAQCVGTITVVDNSKPMISCPDSHLVETCTASGVPYTFSVSATDNCGAAPVSCSHASGSTFPVGTTDVVCSATDAAGNSASCGFQVKVVGDSTAPTITCPGNIAVDACVDGGSTVNFQATATDSCGPAQVSCSHASGSSFPVGTTPVTCTATDGFGNAASCGFTVTVSGNGSSEPPTPGESLGTELWPPNHKYVTLSLADCAAPAQDACGGTLPPDQHGTIFRVSSDEVEDEDGNGDGRTCRDIVIAGDGKTVNVRAEREGTGDGRVYTLHYSLTAPGGGSAQSSCQVFVPHDQSGKHPVVDSGVHYCVGQGCPAGTGGSARCN